MDQTILNNTDLYLQDLFRDFSSLGTLAATIAYFNFEWRFVTLVMVNSLEISELPSFLMAYDRSVIVKLGRIVPRKRIHVPQFVIFGQTSTEIIITLRWLDKSKYDTSGKYLIVCPNADIHICDERQIFQTLAKLYMVNVVLLKDNWNGKPLIFSYQIVKPGRCVNAEPELLSWVENCKTRSCFKSIFSEKLSNFYKCPLYISTLEQPPFMYLNENASNPSGGDGEVIKLIASVMNATLIMRIPINKTDLGHYENDNWTGSLGDAFNSRAHASMCLAPLTSNKHGNFQISFPYYAMDIVWAAKLPALRPSWEKMLNPLNSNIRYILLLMFIGLIFLNILMKVYISKKVKTIIKTMPVKRNLLFYSWLLFLGMPVPKISNRMIFRIIIYTWIWFSFIIRSAYQASLVSSLKRNQYEKRINTWRDVIQYPFGGMASLKEYYMEYPNIYNNWKIVNFSDTFEILDEILDGSSDFVLGVNKDIVKHYVYKFNGTKYLQIVPQKIVKSPAVIYFKKFSPLTKPMNHVLRSAYEVGFIQYFYNKHFNNELNERVFKPGRKRTYVNDKLKMEHFTGCFFILIMGYFVSFIYFLVEIICRYLIKPQPFTN